MGADSPSAQIREAARAASEIIELLELLWEHGRDAAPVPAVSPSQLRVLYCLDREDGINLRRLGELLEAAPSSASRLCDRLQAMGLVERTPSSVSRRELELHLTPKARNYLVELRTRRERALLTVLERMPAHARRDLIKGLQGFRFGTFEQQESTSESPGVQEA